MSNLYKTNQQQQPVGSFDDYDSIVDEFQFPTDHGNNSQYSDVSSMHMSELGGVSVAAANSPARSNVTPTRNTIGGDNEELDGGGVGSPLQFLPSHLVAVNNNNNNNNAPSTRGGEQLLNNSTGGTSEGSSFKLDVDASGYYHVGDYRVGDLGIDTTDVSAILGVASDDVLDEESLLAHAGDNGSSLPTVEDYKKSNVKKLSRKNKNKMHNSSRGDKYEVMNHHQQENVNNVNHRSIGPLGDDLSYADAPNNAMPSSSYPSNEYQRGYDDDSDDDEDEINEGILPNWIAFSSQKSKCIFVSSTALILGSLVLAIVALGVSYGTGSLLINDSENNNNNNGGIESDGGVSGVVVPPPTNSDTGGLITTSTTVGPTLMPTPDALYLVTDAPVSSTTGEGDDESSSKPTTRTTDSPTLKPTSIGTSPIDATSATSIPTVPSRLEPSIVFVSPTVPAVPITTPPTLKLLEPSSSPIITETFTESPISSTIIDNVVSTEPTLSPVTQTSMIPSMNPTSKPSTSTKPSWSFGTESTNGGDVTFYLMADGGSNFRFWSEKLRVLNLEDDQKFMVHLGSAIRAVDNCESTAYLRTQLSLSVSPIPVYSLPGNNDYPECDDPIQGWANYEEHMMSLDTMYWNTTDEYEYEVKRQTNIDRDENFSFLYKRVLFIGLNMVTNDIDENDTAKRLDENINWVVDNVNAYSTNVDVIFIMGYGRLMATENEPFYNAMVNLTRSSTSEEEEDDGTGGVGGEWSDKLLIYARRASETDIEYDIGGNSNFAELRVGNEWPILDVRIRTKGKDAPLVEYRDVVEDDEVDEDEPKML